jgi:hypothetical protein
MYSAATGIAEAGMAAASPNTGSRPEAMTAISATIANRRLPTTSVIPVLSLPA